MGRAWTLLGLSLLALALVACGDEESDNSPTQPQTEATAGSERPEDDRGRCETEGDNLEVSEYDTSGDDYPDVRRVFRRIGTPPLARLVLACREVDLNADGIKDVVRFYNEEGRPLREEADRNLDGNLDVITYFQNGRIMREERDENYDGRVDTKYFYEGGHVVRTERDMAGRSTASEWHPDRWEYYEEGRMVRMGTDVDGDGTVDRWDRDAAWDEERREEDNQETIDEAVAESPEPDSDG